MQPQMRKYEKYVPYLFFILIMLIWDGLVLLAPYLMSAGNRDAAGALYAFFSPTCHQIPERSLFVFGYKMAVCARCAGIYFAMLVGLFVYPIFKRVDDAETPNFWYLLLAVVPIGIDGGTQILADYAPLLAGWGIALPGFLLRHSTNEIRVITGALVGLVMPFYILPMLNEMYFWLSRRAPQAKVNK
ncbi:MAG: DUF2085 domain-containing protein [Candidatus Micrarchaeota archaeon]